MEKKQQAGSPVFHWSNNILIYRDTSFMMACIFAMFGVHGRRQHYSQAISNYDIRGSFETLLSGVFHIDEIEPCLKRCERKLSLLNQGHMTMVQDWTSTPPDFAKNLFQRTILWCQNVPPNSKTIGPKTVAKPTFITNLLKWTNMNKSSLPLV